MTLINYAIKHNVPTSKIDAFATEVGCSTEEACFEEIWHQLYRDWLNNNLFKEVTYVS